MTKIVSGFGCSGGWYLVAVCVIDLVFGAVGLLVAVMARHDDPYAGVVREPGFANLWYGRVPNTRDRAGTLVTCSYFIFEKTRVIRCNSIGRPGGQR